MLDLLLKPPGIKKPQEKKKEISGRVSRIDKPIKSLMKSVSWRIVGTIDTMIISYFITGRLTFAVSIGGAEVFTKTVLYYFHERVWAHIHKIRFNILLKAKRKEYEIEGIERSASGQNTY